MPNVKKRLIRGYAVLATMAVILMYVLITQ